MAESQTITEDDEEFSLTDTVWGKLGLGGVLIWAGMYCDSLFTALESGEQESARINWIIALVYNNLGHDVAVWSIWGMAGLFIVWGLKQLVSGRE